MSIPPNKRPPLLPPKPSGLPGRYGDSDGNSLTAVGIALLIVFFIYAAALVLWVVAS